MTRGFTLLISVIAIGGLTAAAEAGRLEWDTQPATPAWHRNCAFSHQSDAQNPDHRFTVLKGSLKTLARGDGALYAVFLKGDDDLKTLARVLKSSGWLGAASDQALTVEWLPLQTNGIITVYADEAHQPDKKWVVVVNGDGEILGGRTLWSPDGDLALLTDTLD